MPEVLSELVTLAACMFAAAVGALYYAERARRREESGQPAFGKRRAVVIPATPDPEERAREISREIDLEYATAAMLEHAAASGVHMDAEEARRQAEDILQQSGLWGR